MRMPSTGTVTQGFSSYHQAVDIAFIGGGNASYGKPIVAPQSGKVTYVGQMGSGTLDAGTVVQIESGNRLHRLCHLIPGSPTVRVGQSVREGQKVGEMGYSGYVLPKSKAGTHLHWVMEINGVRVDGRKYVTKASTKGGEAVNEKDLDAVYLYGPLGRKRRGNEGEDVYLGKTAAFVLADHAKSREAKTRAKRAKTRAANAKREVTDLKAKVAALTKDRDAWKAKVSTGGTADPATVEAASKWQQLKKLLNIK